MPIGTQNAHRQRYAATGITDSTAPLDTTALQKQVAKDMASNVASYICNAHDAHQPEMRAMQHSITESATPKGSTAQRQLRAGRTQQDHAVSSSRSLCTHLSVCPLAHEIQTGRDIYRAMLPPAKTGCQKHDGRYNDKHMQHSPCPSASTSHAAQHSREHTQHGKHRPAKATLGKAQQDIAVSSPP